jgi:hypothetical protein
LGNKTKSVQAVKPLYNMADTEETPAQRQARIRREKREAKIKGTAQERLEKITKLSGRTPEMSEYSL